MEQYTIKYQFKAKDGIWETVENKIFWNGKGKHNQIEKWLKQKYKEIIVLSVKYC